MRRCRKMNLPLPLHFTDILYKDPDAAVCACMGRSKTVDIERFEMNGVAVATPGVHAVAVSCEMSASDILIIQTTPLETVTTGLGYIGCGMKSYSPLGTEIWGRSLLVFHNTAPTDLAAVSDVVAVAVVKAATSLAGAEVASNGGSGDVPSSSSLNTLLYLPLLSTLDPKITDIVSKNIEVKGHDVLKTQDSKHFHLENIRKKRKSDEPVRVK